MTFTNICVMMMVLVFSVDVYDEDTKFDWEEALENVQNIKEQWEAQGIDDYIYRFHLNAFTHPLSKHQNIF